MRKTMSFAGIAVAMLFAPSANAAPVDYNCDTPIGSYSQLVQAQAGPAYRVQGSLTPLTWRDDPDRQWAPVGQVRLESSDGARWISLGIGRQPNAARGRIEVRVQAGDGRRPTVLGEVGLNEAMPFALQSSPSGEAVVIVGGERHVFRIELGSNGKVEATCSTGEFLFRGVDFGG